MCVCVGGGGGGGVVDLPGFGCGNIERTHLSCVSVGRFGNRWLTARTPSSVRRSYFGSPTWA